MGYKSALEAAGATIHAFKEFGSYQGEWVAKVTYKGETGWIEGNYGSCSGCDAFQMEFGYDDSDKGCDEHEYETDPAIKLLCPDCTDAAAGYAIRLKAFGETYLDTIFSQELQEQVYKAKLADMGEWSYGEYKEMFDFIKENR